MTSRDVSSQAVAGMLRWRAEFPILEHTTYLISNSLGAMPRGAETGLSDYARAWRERGVRAWHEGWWEMPAQVGDLIAPLLGVTPGHVSMHQNVMMAAQVFLSCLDYPSERNRLVYTDLEFPSLQYLLQGEKRRGADLVTVPSPDGIRVDLEQLLEAIDERTRVVPISHVLFRSAYVQDAEKIAARCRETGALLLLDTYQSAGVLPLELEEWGVDAAVGGCLKWLCGGPGNAFLWVRPDLGRRLEPAFTGWQSDVEPFAFRKDHQRVESGAWRFLTGTPNIPALHAARAGLEILNDIEPLDLRRRSLELTSRLLDSADRAGFEIRSPRNDEERGGTVTLWHPQAEHLSEGLLAREVICDYRPGSGIRLSPHFYTTDEECDHAIETLVEIAGLP